VRFIWHSSLAVPSQLLPSDLVLDPAKPECRSTNLKVLSIPRLHKLATIHTSSLVRYLGVVIYNRAGRETAVWSVTLSFGFEERRFSHG